jgi:triacylglycerol esterase/lipase EstA (alpha/beta hydrolase family)
MAPMMRRDACAVLVMLAALWGGCSGSSVPGDAEVDAPGADADDADAEVDAAPDADEDDGGPDADEDEPLECGPELEVVDRGVLELDGGAVAGEVEPCSVDRYALVAAYGSRVELELTLRGLFGVEAAVAYPDAADWDRRLAEASAIEIGAPVELELEPHRSGEYAVLVRAALPEVAQRYDLAARCAAGCDLEATRYPILLVHGWTGFDEIGPLEYFYHVPDELVGHGYLVAVATLDPYNSIEVRAGQLAPQVDELLTEARATKVNIIAHSQGGLDSRHLITTLGYGDRVASLTTIATPHQGTPICDVALGILPGPGEEVLAGLLNLIGAGVMGSDESDARASFASLSEDYVQNVFNPATPDDPRVHYISWMGRTCLLGDDCGDVCDVEIFWSYEILLSISGENDGIVPVSSAPWGDYRGEVPADHFDEVGQLFGVTNENFDHLAFYLERARDLIRDGH